jgi:hypothetical protein
VAQESEVDQGLASVQLDDGPCGQQRDRHGCHGESAGGSPAPGRAVGQDQEQAGHSEAQDGGAWDVDGTMAGRAGGQHHDRDNQGQRAHDGTEPEG